MQVLACIQVLFITATTTKYAILDLILLNADTDVSTPVEPHVDRFAAFLFDAVCCDSDC